MSDRSAGIVVVICGTIVLLAFLGALFFTSQKAIETFGGLDPKYGASLAAAIGTVLVSVISIVVSRHLETRTIIQKEHREKKSPVYEDLLAFMFKVTMGAKTGNVPSEVEIIQFMSEFTQRSMVWASDDVLKSWIAFRELSIVHGEQSGSGYDLLMAYDALIRAIRKDLGHKNSGLQNGKLLSLFINDLNKHIDKDGNPVP